MHVYRAVPGVAMRQVTRRWVLRAAWRAGAALPLAGCLACARQSAGSVALTPRKTAYTATLLPDGSILLVGGIADGPLADAQRAVPATGQWVAAGRLSAARSSHTATLLLDGAVLVVGGNNGNLAGAATASVERYDPRANRWAADAPLATPRMRHRAVALDDGAVLAIGGIGGWRVGDRPLAAVERYDPAARHWRSAASLTMSRDDCATVRLADGRVLAVGGGGSAASTAEVYDPRGDTWTPTAPPARNHSRGQSLVLLADGRVLVAGGSDPPEIYDPQRDEWALFAPAPFPPDSVVRVASGADLLLAFDLRNVARYDMSAAMWQAASSASPRSGGLAVPLSDGTVALVGGGAVRGGPEPPPIEIYHP